MEREEELVSKGGRKGSGKAKPSDSRVQEKETYGSLGSLQEQMAPIQNEVGVAHSTLKSRCQAGYSSVLSQSQ